MNYQQNFAFWRSRLVSLISVVTLYGFTGCGDPGDALPGASNVTIRHDASVKRDIASAAGGAGGGTTVAAGSGGSGGSGGTTDVGLGTGGSTTTVPDASIPRDTVPDSTTTVPDASIPRDTLPDLASDTAWNFLDVGVGPETSVTLDTAAEVQKDGPPVSLDVSPPDASVEGLPDAMVDARDAPADVIAPEAGDLVNNDLPSDLPADLTALPPDTADAPTSDTADAPPAPSCSNPGWAKQFQLRTQGSLAGDKEGNLFLSSSLLNSVDFGGTAGTLTAIGDYDALVVRFDPATGTAVWATQFGDAQQQNATGVAVDKSGHVGIIGDYIGSMTIGPSGAPTSDISNLGSWPYAFVGGLQAADGNGLWARSASLRADDGSSGILAAISANPNFDDFVVCGKANVAATDLVPGATAGGGYDIVVAKVKGSDGSLLWYRQIGGAGDQSCTAAAIDDSGNVFIAGKFNGQLDFGGGALTPAPSATTTSAVPWIAKLSGSDGSTIAAASASPPPTGKVQSTVFGIDTDSGGNVAIAGAFNSAITFGSTTITAVGLSQQDAFVAKFGPSLTHTWAKNWGDSKTQTANSLAFDSSGNLVVLGGYLSTINIGRGGAILTASSDVTGSNTDIFLAHISGASGEPQCALSYGDPASQSAYNVVVPRSAGGAMKDVTFSSGQFVGGSVLNFTSATLDATSLSDPAYFWMAKF